MSEVACILRPMEDPVPLEDVLAERLERTAEEIAEPLAPPTDWPMSFVEADAFLERMALAVERATNGEQRPVSDARVRVVVEGLDGKPVAGVVQWVEEGGGFWTVSNDDLGRLSWACMARVGAI